MAPKRLLCVCILIAAFGRPGFSPAAELPVAGLKPGLPGVEAVARQLYESYAEGDLEGAMTLWSPAAPDRAAFRGRLSRVLRVRCVEVRSIDVTRVEVNGDVAVVDLTASLVKWSRRTGAALQDAELATLTFGRDSAGAWLVTGWKRQEDALADALMAAKSPAEQQRLLAEQPRLVNPELNRTLDRREGNLINQERYAEATALGRLIENIAARIGDLSGLSAARGNQSVILRRQPQFDLDESLRDAREAVDFAEASGNADDLAFSLLRLGRTERWCHVSSDGKASFLRVLGLLDDVQSLVAPAIAAGELAEYYGALGDRRASMHYAFRSIELSAATGDLVSQLNAELHLASEYEGDGDWIVALRHLERAVELAHQANVTGSVPAEALYDAAACHLRLGQEAEFFRALRQGAAERGQAAEETTAIAHSLLASYYYDHGDLLRAEAEATQARRMARTGFRTNLQDSSLEILGMIALKRRRPLEALSLASQLEYSEARQRLVAGAYRMLGRRRDAYRELLAFYQTFDDDCDQPATDERAMVFRIATRIAPLLDLTEMFVEDGRFAEALDAAETAKGRVLLDVLRGGRGMAEAMMTGEERRREREIEVRVTGLNAQLRTAPSPKPSVQVELAQARADLEEYRSYLYGKYPRLKAQQADIGVVTRAQMAELLPDRSSAFLEYVVGEARTSVFLIRRAGAGVVIRCRTIPVSQKRLAARVEGYVDAIAARDRLYAAPAHDLYRLLVAPFEADLRGIKTLGVVPDGPLWRLPFESLLAGDDRFLIERMAVFYAPSITVYRQMTRRDRSMRAPGAFLAFANPPVPSRGGTVSDMKLRSSEYAPLPDAAREVEGIAPLFHSAAATRIYLGAEALESRVKEESPGYAVIHFATHGVLDDHDPMFSHLVLAPKPGDPSEDGLLETWEMMQLDLHANLAVLSACDTARGTVHAGAGLIGMSWALSVAGTSSTIVTQWKIASSTTAGLMVDFYREWLGARAGAPFAKAEALRQARLHVLADRAHRHPFFWSAFVLIGSGS